MWGNTSFSSGYFIISGGWFKPYKNRASVNKVHDLCMNNSSLRQYLNKIRQLTQTIFQTQFSMFIIIMFFLFCFFFVLSKCVNTCTHTQPCMITMNWMA